MSSKAQEENLLNAGVNVNAKDGVRRSPCAETRRVRRRDRRVCGLEERRAGRGAARRAAAEVLRAC